MSEASINQWNSFLALIAEAKEFLLRAEQGEMCLDQLKSLSDRGMQILSADAEEKLQMVILDISLMDVLFKIFQLNVRTLSPDKFVFDPVIHAHKILQAVEGKSGQNMISTLSPIAARVLSHRAPTLSVMSGALEITDPEKKARVPNARLPKDKVEPLKAPEKVDKLSGLTLEETVLEIQKQLEATFIANDKAPLNYIKFAFHPTSFSKTAENIFHIAVLVNNNDASIFLDKQKRPWIKPVPKGSQTKSRDSKCALVMGLTQDEWKEAVRLFDIKEPMINLVERDIPGNAKAGSQKRRHK